MFGTDSLNHNTGSEYKFFFDKVTGAIRGGIVDNQSWDTDSLGLGSLGIGYNSIATGNYSIALGHEAVASGVNSIALGRYTEALSYTETVIGAYNTNSLPNSTDSRDINDRLFVIGNGTSSTRSDAMIVYKSGNTEINGDLTISGSLNYPSDIRLKENITTSKYGIEDILNIQVRDYEFKKESTNHLHTGFLAQQLHTVFPHAVHEGGDDEKTNPWSVDYASLTPLLAKGIQDQQVQIEQLKIENDVLILENNKQNSKLQNQQVEIEILKTEVSKIQQLEQQNAEMKAMLEQIQAQLNIKVVEISEK